MGNCFLYKRGMGSGGGIIPEIEKTVLGKLIAVSDSADKPLKRLRIFGKTTQNGTPSPDAPVPLVSPGDGGSLTVSVAGKNLLDVSGFANTVNGVAVTIFEDGLIHCKGTATTDGGRIASNCYVTLIPGKYAVNVFTESKNPITALPMEGLFFSNNDESHAVIAKISESELSTTFSLTETTEICFGFNTKTSTMYDESFYVLLTRTENNSTVYEPYKGQTLTVSTPNGLPGIPVSEGGNYTDENGQQWVCDEVDFAGGKYIQRVGRIAHYAGENLSTAYMSATGSLSNGAEILYVLAAPIETPLSSEELAQYAALHTYSPTTTIYNDGGAYMELKYIAKGG